jgi:nucleotide-binding universal stress UspA family protein
MAGEIVLGYDGSDNARAALAKAVDLARRLEAPLVIAYGYRVSLAGGEVQDYAAALRELGERCTADGAARAREAGIEPEVQLVEGDPAEVLAELASLRQAEAIVVGTRGESPLRGAILGSVPHKLLHLSEVPVLVVPG